MAGDATKICDVFPIKRYTVYTAIIYNNSLLRNQQTWWAMKFRKSQQYTGPIRCLISKTSQVEFTNLDFTG